MTMVSAKLPVSGGGIMVFMARHAVFLGLLIRLVLAWLLPRFLDDELLIPGVAYTDIDL